MDYRRLEFEVRETGIPGRYTVELNGSVVWVCNTDPYAFYGAPDHALDYVANRFAERLARVLQEDEECED